MSLQIPSLVNDHNIPLHFVLTASAGTGESSEIIAMAVNGFNLGVWY